MFSAEIRRRRQLSYGGDKGFVFTNCEYRNNNCRKGFAGGSDIIAVSPNTVLMAGEESSRNDDKIFQHGEKSNSKDHKLQLDEDDHQEDWLQLGIGISRTTTTADLTTTNNKLVELELMPNSSSSYIHYNNNNSNGISGDHLQMRPSLTAGQQLRAPWSAMIINNNAYATFNNPSLLFPQHHQEAANWGFGLPQVPFNNIIASSSSSFTNPSNSSASPSNYFPRFYPGLETMPQRSIDFGVIQAPRRPYSGIWFMLQASLNQAKEPFLPQLPKKYLRIKDSKMTIQLVIKYLVNKLKLEHESEIEITCRGQKLQPLATLQHVRDNIWMSNNCSSDFITLLPNSSTTDHIMILYYGRTE